MLPVQAGLRMPEDQPGEMPISLAPRWQCADDRGLRLDMNAHAAGGLLAFGAKPFWALRILLLAKTENRPPWSGLVMLAPCAQSSTSCC